MLYFSLFSVNLWGFYSEAGRTDKIYYKNNKCAGQFCGLEP